MRRETFPIKPRYSFENGRFKINGEEFSNDKYEIIGILSEGTNAVVLRARDRLSDRLIALKVWLPRKNTKYPDKERFLEEIKKLSYFNREKIVQLYEAGFLDENKLYYYAALEYVEGITLEEWLKGNPELTKRCHILIDICNEINFIYSNNIFHGDLHWRNVMLTKADIIKILDFSTSIFAKRKHINPEIREGKILLKTALQIIPEEKSERLLSLDLVEQSSKVIPFALTALAKLHLLREGIKNGTDNYGRTTFLEDFASIIVDVPLFDLHSIFNYVKGFVSEGFYLDSLLLNIKMNSEFHLGVIPDRYFFYSKSEDLSGSEKIWLNSSKTYDDLYLLYKKWSEKYMEQFLNKVTV